MPSCTIALSISGRSRVKPSKPIAFCVSTATAPLKLMIPNSTPGSPMKASTTSCTASKREPVGSVLIIDCEVSTTKRIFTGKESSFGSSVQKLDCTASLLSTGPSPSPGARKRDTSVHPARKTNDAMTEHVQHGTGNEG